MERINGLHGALQTHRMWQKSSAVPPWLFFNSRNLNSRKASVFDLVGRVRHWGTFARGIWTGIGTRVWCLQGALSANEYKLCLQGHSRGQDNIQAGMLGSEATLPGQIGTVAIYPPCPSSCSLISFVSRLNTASSLHSTWLLSKPVPPNANTSSFLSVVGHCSGKPLTPDYALLLWHTVLAV